MSAIVAAADPSALSIAEPLWHSYGGSSVTGFPGPGTWLIFAVILMPIWVMIGAWFLGKPGDSKTGLMGVTYLVGITSQMWLGMLILTLLLGVVFYGGLPSPIG